MKTRIFTYLACECGHRGAIIESVDAGASPDGWYQACLHNLTHTGAYEGFDELFAETRPGCPKCRRSLSPDDVVGRSALPGVAELSSSKSGKLETA